MPKKADKNLPQIKKDLKTFLLSEEGKIVEKNAVKLGVSLLAIGGALSGVMKPSDVQAECVHASHASHGSHSSHGSHNSHYQGGWC
ncbi:MAG: hypothetical protein KAJ18_04060 [Candidatus Omnitrophica bacterium]|nr:hypothetical protein [Candidatus Omnitrophota bacterium]